MKVSKITTIRNQRSMLEALKKTDFVISSACNLVGIHTSTHYRWMKKFPYYHQAYKNTWEYVIKVENIRYEKWKKKMDEDLMNLIFGNDKKTFK
jgi:hypothetical protein